MEQHTRTIPIRQPQFAANRKLWLLLSTSLLLLLAWGGTASAATMNERVKPEPGVLLVAIGEETPASEAGLARGDILLAIDGDMVNTAAELQHVILMRDPGEILELTVKRGNEELTLKVTLADREGYPFLGVAPLRLQDSRISSHGGRSPVMRGFRSIPGMRKGMNNFRFAVGEGAAIMEVLEESPAAAAGLMAGDLITAVGETEISGISDLADAVAAHSPGDEIELTVSRDGESLALSLTLGTHPENEEKAFIGVSIAPTERFRINMNGSDREWRRPQGNRFGFANPRNGGFDHRFFFSQLPEGALVMGVRDEGPAQIAELESGDVITAIDETEVANFQELTEALANYSPGDEVVLSIIRLEESISATVTLGAHPEDETKAYLGVMIMPLERFRMHMQDNRADAPDEQAHEEEQQSLESESNS